MAGEAGLGVTLSRTLIPTLPSHFLSRKHLFPLIENRAPGATMVIAPTGYGKSTLVAEWAQTRPDSVIWLTVSNQDSLNDMSAMFIAATRNLIPEFAPWFERDQPLRPSEVVRRWGNELLQTGREYTFVLDNLRNASTQEVDVSSKLLEQFPSNVHFVAIRAEESESVFASLSSRGPIKVVTSKDLRFSDEEKYLLATSAGLELTPALSKLLQVANGWPSATSLLVEHLHLRGQMKDVESILATEVEPLRALALLVIRNLDQDIRSMCEKLSVTESFTLELAREILGDQFSYERVNEVALRGEIFSISRDPEAGFIFSPMMREIFSEEFRKREVEKLQLHERLTEYFIGRGEPGLALEQAFHAGNTEKIRELFPAAARVKQAKGHGDDLIRWAVSVNDGSVDGELGKSTIEIAGFLANLNFDLASAQLSRLELAAHNSIQKDFYLQFVAGGQSYVNLAFGKFDEVEACIESSHTGLGGCYLGVDDQISLLRVLATKRYIWNESEKVDEVFAIAEQLGKQTVLTTSHTFLLSIQAMSLHLRGEFQKAFDIAVNALAQYKRHGYVGNHGPLDVMYVKARCLLEFSRISEAISIFEQIRNLAFQWKQWHWYLTAENHILQELMGKGQKTQVLERIKGEREFIQSFDTEHKLEAFIDINELYPRFVLNDLNRLEVLVSRTPQTRDVLQYKLFVDGTKEFKVVAKEVANLSERTPRDLIWKHLSLAINNISSESIAFKHVEQALKVGSTVGARETFLRQIDQIGNLILKVANQSPTIYNESLASAMAERMRERGDAVTEGIPTLTKRELEILRQLSTGRTLTVIAGELHISQNTMKTHLKNLYKKLGADGRTDAVEKAKTLYLL